MVDFGRMKKTVFIIGYNIAAQAIGKIFSLILGFIYVFFLSRYLGREGFGNYSLIFAYLSLFSIIGDLGLQLSTVRESVNERNLPKAFFGTYFWLKLLLTGLFALFSIFPLIFLPFEDYIKKGILIALIGFAIGNINTLGTSVFQAKLHLDWVALTEIFGRLTTILFILIFIYFDFGFYFITLTIFLGNLISSILIIKLLKGLVVINFDFDCMLAKRLIKQSIPISLVSVMTILYFKLDTIILSILRGSQEVGIYSLSYKIVENILIFWGFYIAVIYPIMSNYWQSNRINKFKTIWQKSILLALIAGSFIILFGYFASAPLIIFLGSEEFRESIISLRILLFSVPLFFLNNMFFHFFVITEKVFIPIVLVGSSLIVNTILNLLLIPIFGFISVAINVFIMEFLLFILYFFTKRKLNYIL